MRGLCSALFGALFVGATSVATARLPEAPVATEVAPTTSIVRRQPVRLLAERRLRTARARAAAGLAATGTTARTALRPPTTRAAVRAGILARATRDLRMLSGATRTLRVLARTTRALTLPVR